MNAFARALAALHRDANLSVVCSWAPAWERDWQRRLRLDLEAGTATLATELTTLRGVETTVTEGAFVAGPMGGMAQGTTLDLAVADLPDQPARNDVVSIVAIGYLVETPTMDVEGVSWRLTLSDFEVAYTEDEVAPPVPVDPEPIVPVSVEVGAWGDSYVALSRRVAPLAAHDPRGPLHWANQMLGAPMRERIEAIEGVIGETTTQQLARLANVQAISPVPRYVLLASPFNNDINSGLSHATSISNFAAMVAAVEDLNAIPIAGPTIPRDGWSGAQVLACTALNAAAAALASSTSLIWVDWTADVIDTGTGFALPNMLYDGIHIGARAAKLMGAQIAAALSFGGEGPLCIADDTTNWLTNGLLEGAGAPGGGWTGSIATSWVQLFGGTTTAGTRSMAKVARDDGFGEWQEIRMDGLQSASTAWGGGIMQTVNPLVVGLVAGDWCEVIAEFEVEGGATNYLQPFIRVDEDDGVDALRYSYSAFALDADAHIPEWPDTIRLVVRSPPFQIRTPVGTPSVAVRLGASAATNFPGGTTAVTRIGRVAGRKIV